jgi:hypothetical protein
MYMHLPFVLWCGYNMKWLGLAACLVVGAIIGSFWGASLPFSGEISKGKENLVRRQNAGRFAYYSLLQPFSSQFSEFETNRDRLFEFGKGGVVKRAAALCFNLKMVIRTSADVVFLTLVPDLLDFFPNEMRNIFIKSGCKVRVRTPFIDHKKAVDPSFRELSPFSLDIFDETQYDRIIALDLDILVVRNVDMLFHGR